MSKLAPGRYNTKSHLRRDDFGNVMIEKDLMLERALMAAGATRIDEHTWELHEPILPPPTRPAPPMPKIKAPRPDYETMRRDEFAMAALSGLVAGVDWTVADTLTLAQDAYRLADAMLGARK